MQRSTYMGWGSIKTVTQTLSAIHTLLKKGEWTHFINLSGADYPVRPISSLSLFLSSPNNLHTNFIKYGLYPLVLQGRLLEYYVPTKHGFTRQTGMSRDDGSTFHSLPLIKSPIEMWSKMDLPDGVHMPFKSPAWFTLTFEFCSYLIENLPSLLEFLTYASTTFASDEFFFQTVLFNSKKFKNTSFLGNLPKKSRCGVTPNSECGSNMRYILFEGNSPHPTILTLANKDAIYRDHTVFFVRKVSMYHEESRVFMDWLDENVHNKRGLGG